MERTYGGVGGGDNHNNNEQRGRFLLGPFFSFWQ